MRLLIERDDGSIVEVREIESTPESADTLFFFSGYTLYPSDMDAMEEALSRKTGRRCVVLDRKIEKIMGISMGGTAPQQK